MQIIILTLTFVTLTGYQKAIDGIRTRDPDLGKVVLYQLSHYRVCFSFLF